MKRSKLACRLASALLTGAMVVSMGGLTAFAEETPVIPISGNEITLTKTVTRSNNALYPNTSFTFTVTPEGTAGQPIDDTGNPVIYGGVTGGVSFGTDADTITVTPDDTAESFTTKLTLNVSVFDTPGVYRYKVAETPGDYDGMIYQDDYYYLDVYVVNGENGKVIDGVTAHKVTENEDGTTTVAEAKSGLDFTNTHTTNTLTVTKIITGNQAYTDGEFNITITVTGQAGEKFASNYTDANGNTVTFETGVSQTVTLGNNDSVIIYGLSKSDTYTVVENDEKVTTDNYTVSYYDGVYDAANPETHKVAGINNLAEGTEDKNVTVVNEKDFATPTGVAMTFAPYILLVAAAGVFAVLFLRRRREEF